MAKKDTLQKRRLVMADYVFSFSKLRVVALAVALLLLVVTSFGGGVLATLAWQSREQARAPLPEKLPLPVLPSATPPAPAPAVDPPAPAPAAVEVAARPGEPSTRKEAVAESTAQPEAEPDAPVSAIQLAIVVGSFLDPANAQRIADELREMGLEPKRFTRRDGSEKTWYAVRLGPYADWDSASRFAAQVQTQTGATPAIRPY